MKENMWDLRFFFFFFFFFFFVCFFFVVVVAFDTVTLDNFIYN